jgi:hypothetical protein
MATPNLTIPYVAGHMTIGEAQSASARLLHFITYALRQMARPDPRLDFDTMPDHMKRDLGFLDGQEPHYEDNLIR